MAHGGPVRGGLLKDWLMDKPTLPADLWPATTVEMRPVEELVPYARNARTHPPEQVEQIAASMRRFGFTIPMLVAEDGTIISGHGRLMAAQRLGLAEVPVMVAKGWSDEDRRVYCLADNRLAETSEWDPETLALEWRELVALGAGDDLSMIGFSQEDIEDLVPGVLGESGAGLTDPDDVPEPPARAVTVAGDVWVMGKHRLRCGDSTSATDVEALLAGVKPHLMVTDPPYGVNYSPRWRNEIARLGHGVSKEQKVLNDDRADWREVWALFPGDVAYVWCASLTSDDVIISLEKASFNRRSMIVWAKQLFTLGRGDYHWQHELCWYSVRKGGKSHWCGSRKYSTLWEIESKIGVLVGKGADAPVGHSTQKPVECMKRPIENNSSPGQAVYEPFSGSGTTIIAGEMTGRCVYAMELSPEYVDVAVKRWQEFTGQKATLEGDGRSFDEIAEERLRLAA